MDQQAVDHDDLATAVGAAAAAAAAAAHAHQLGLGELDDPSTHHFHHQLQPPDFSKHHLDDPNDQHHHHHHHNHHQEVDVSGLELPVDEDEDDVNAHDLDLSLHLENAAAASTQDLNNRFHNRFTNYGRPPSIRKACDLCHAAKQKCSGDRPTCTRCAAGGWDCVYAPRQRRRTVPKEMRAIPIAPAPHIDIPRMETMEQHIPPPPPPQNVGKKRKLNIKERSPPSVAPDPIVVKAMAAELDMNADEENEVLISLPDDQMLESIAIDGYLADLPLATFQNNLPYVPPPPPPEPQFNPIDFQSGDMDQHTTSALRDAIFSLNESHDATNVDQVGDDQGDGQGNADEMDPHLALLDLSQAMPEAETGQDGTEDLGLNIPAAPTGNTCNHPPLVPHILHLLHQHSLDPKHGSNTPLTLGIFAPLARSLRLFHALVGCSNCMTSPHQTLPQLALLSRTTTILTYPFPPINSSSINGSAQIKLHGARLSGTGLSEAIEQHIVGVVWDSWRAAVREIFANIERKAQDVITQTAMAGSSENGPNHASTSSPETQRAGLLFQAMSRLVTAMDEVEGA